MRRNLSDTLGDREEGKRVDAQGIWGRRNSSAKALRQECASLFLRRERESEYSEDVISSTRRVREVSIDMFSNSRLSGLTPNLFFKGLLFSVIQQALWQRWPQWCCFKMVRSSCPIQQTLIHYQPWVGTVLLLGTPSRTTWEAQMACNSQTPHWNQNYSISSEWRNCVVSKCNLITMRSPTQDEPGITLCALHTELHSDLAVTLVFGLYTHTHTHTHTHSSGWLR